MRGGFVFRFRLLAFAFTFAYFRFRLLAFIFAFVFFAFAFLAFASISRRGSFKLEHPLAADTVIRLASPGLLGPVESCEVFGNAFMACDVLENQLKYSTL